MPPTVWGTPAVVPRDSTWLVVRFESVGLDGQICAEYICSLRELHRLKAERVAAVTDFLSDCLATSSLPVNQRDAFVQETLRLLEGGDPAPVKAAPTPAVGGGFRKGIKLTGNALREVVGNVRPTYTQRYSDDEGEKKETRPLPPRPIVREVSSRSQDNFPSLAPAEQKRRRQKARELAPDEDWGEPVIEHHQVVAQKRILERPPSPRDVVVDKTGSERPPSPRGVVEKTGSERPPEVVVEERFLEPEPENIPPPPPPVPETVAPSTFSALAVSPVLTNDVPILDYHIPDNILSFDFKFEDEDEEEDTTVHPAASPLDLFRQMFALPEEPVIKQEEPQPVQAVPEKSYSTKFLLRVLADLRPTNIPVPIELASLSYRNAEQPRSHASSWRRAGSPNKQRRSPPAAESPDEGFW